MSIIVSCINHKGGVGKTTVCAHIGYALAVHHGLRVLLVDFDSQSNLTRFFYAADAVPLSLTDVFSGSCRVQDIILSPQPNLMLLPATLNLTNIEHSLTTESNYHALGDVLRPLTGTFDIALIDCPPSLMTMTLNAMSASTDVCIITTTDRLAIEGIGAIIQAVQQVQQTRNPYLALSSVVVSHFEQRKAVAREGLAIVERYFADGTVLAPTIPYSVAVQEAIWHTKTVFQHKHSSKAGDAFTDLTTAFAERYLPNVPLTSAIIPATKRPAKKTAASKKANGTAQKPKPTATKKRSQAARSVSV